MPLDRLVIVRTSVTTFNDFGESVEVTTDHRVWAQLLQDGIARTAFEGGVYANADRVWRVRYNQLYVDALSEEGNLYVLYEGVTEPDPSLDFKHDIITRTAEPTGAGRNVRENRRRRFLDLLS